MLHVRTMIGLGDAFAARPTIAALTRKHGGDQDIVIETPWPEVFWDIVVGDTVRFLKPRNLNIRCAQRNVEETRVAWLDENSDLYRDQLGAAKRIQLSYSLHPGCKSIPEQIAESAGVKPEWRDLFFKNSCSEGSLCLCNCHENRSSLAVFRIPTIRTEYRNPARNPAPGLVAAAVDEIGGDWISLNDLNGNERHLEDESFPKRRPAHSEFGQLSIPTCLDLVSRARCVVTPISWMAWAALAYGTPTLCVWGGYCDENTIFGPLLRLATEFHIVAPDKMCRCFNPTHDCAKSIPIERVKEAAHALTSGRG